MRAKRLMIASFCLLVLGGNRITGQTIRNGWTVYVENDLFYETDRYYTNGLRHQLDFPDGYVPVGWRSSLLKSTLDRFLEKFEPCTFDRNACFSFSRSLGQNLYSPNTIRSRRLLPGQRPYGAWLYYGGILNLKSADTLHTLEMDLGVVGPWAGGEFVQTNWHRLLRSVSGEETPIDPEGWENQIGNQPGLQALYRVKHRVIDGESPRMGRYFDVIPEGGLALGTVYVYPHAGATARLGINISNDLGPDVIPAAAPESAVPQGLPMEGPPANRMLAQDDDLARGRRPPAWEFYVFGRVEGRYVLHNVFLDGHIDGFGAEHSVDREPFVNEYSYGAAVRWKLVTLSVTAISRGEEFERQLDRQDFHSLRISVQPRRHW